MNENHLFYFFFRLEYADNLGMSSKSNGVDHSSADDSTSNGNTDDSHKQHLLDLIEKF